ncbi:MAG TPA: FtsX-like permease family protein [Gemmatimonadales bacterium]|nr:FtsX-like permease family protein [Gemmatimonadales bacterium]
MIQLRRTLVPAAAGLRAFWPTAMLVVATATVALMALLPVASLSGATSVFLPRLSLPAAPAIDLGIRWSSVAQGPSDLHALGITALFRLLLGVAAALAGVALLAISAVAAARAQQRQGEVSIHRSVGASRRHLVLSHGAEGVVVSLLGLGVGAVLGRTIAVCAARYWPGHLAPTGPLPGISAAAALAGAMVLGALFPLVYARRRVPRTAVGGEPLGLAIPTFQLGLSLTVLVAAVLLWRGAGGSARRGPSDTDLTVIHLAALTGSAAAARSAQYAGVLAHVRSAAGVRIAALTSPGTVSGAGESDIAVVHCGDGCSLGGLPLPYQTARAMHYAVSPDSFNAMGLPIIAGRGIADTDTWRAPRVAVVNQAFAIAHFERGDPLGHELRLGAGPWSRFVVVGVVADQPVEGVGGGAAPANAIYVSVLQQPPPNVDLLVRGGVPAAVAGAARAALGPAAGPLRTTSNSEIRATQTAPVRWFAALFGLVGCALLIVATAGTATVVHQWVASLAVELGVRRAAGASRQQVVAFVLIRLIAMAGVGAMIGVWLGTGVWGTLHQAVPGVPAWDARTVLEAAGVLVGAAMAGGLAPAVRAALASPAGLMDSA